MRIWRILTDFSELASNLAHRHRTTNFLLLTTKKLECWMAVRHSCARVDDPPDQLKSAESV